MAKVEAISKVTIAIAPWVCFAVAVASVAKWGGLDVKVFLDAALNADVSQERPHNLLPLAIAILAPWLLGGAGWVLFSRERQRHRESIERLGNEKKRLQSLIDAGRTSSGLDRRGNTHPEDV